MRRVANYTRSVLLERGFRRVYELLPPLFYTGGQMYVTPFALVSAARVAPQHFEIIPLAAYDRSGRLHAFLPLDEPVLCRDTELDVAVVDAVRRLGYEVVIL